MDLTDERQSCYFEAGCAEALPRPVTYVASKQSVLKLGKLHFDIHKNVQFFTNRNELQNQLGDAINRTRNISMRGRAKTSGRLEKFFSPSLRESDSVTARENGQMERASHGTEGLFRS